MKRGRDIITTYVSDYYNILPMTDATALEMPHGILCLATLTIPFFCEI